MHQPTRRPTLLARTAAALLPAFTALAALLAACGGGVGTGGTGTYAAGPITGFGSIIVNDVRFEETNAAIFDDDGLSHARSELRLGMTVEIDAGAVGDSVDGAVANATTVRFGSEILGPVAAVDRDAGTLTVLGQTVRIAVETVFDERLPGGLAALTPGRIVEVYALYDAASASYSATRIEPRATAASWRLRGPVAAVDAAARTMRIGSANFAYAGATATPAALAVGDIVRLRLNLAPDAGGRFGVAAFGIGVRAPEDRDDARVRGLVTAYTSQSRFSVNGVPVDASAASFPGGLSGLRLGARVDVEASSSAGVLRATRVHVESDNEARDRGFQLNGTIDSADAAARSFVLRGVTVSTARSDLRLDDGTLADLLPGRRVDVKAQLSADRTRLEATRIKFK